MHAYGLVPNKASSPLQRTNSAPHAQYRLPAETPPDVAQYLILLNSFGDLLYDTAWGDKVNGASWLSLAHSGESHSSK